MGRYPGRPPQPPRDAAQLRQVRPRRAAGQARVMTVGAWRGWRFRPSGRGPLSRTAAVQGGAEKGGRVGNRASRGTRGCGWCWSSTCWQSPTSRARFTRAGRWTRFSRRRRQSRRSTNRRRLPVLSGISRGSVRRSHGGDDLTVLQVRESSQASRHSLRDLPPTRTALSSNHALLRTVSVITYRPSSKSREPSMVRCQPTALRGAREVGKDRHIVYYKGCCYRTFRALNWRCLGRRSPVQGVAAI